MRALVVAVLAVIVGTVLVGMIVWWQTAGESGTAAVKNPFYVRGQHLLEEGSRKEAAAAFRKAIRPSPEAPQPHLQLAMLYDDHQNRPAGTIYHYKRYLELLEGQSDSRQKDAVRKWLRDAERDYLQQLATEHGDFTNRWARREELPAEKETEGKNRITPRERKLAQKVKELNTERIRLERRLRRVKAEAGEATSASGPEMAGTDADSGGSEKPEKSVEVYQVRKGDTLYGICERRYGNGGYWDELLRYNDDKLQGDPEINAGVRIKLPPQKVLENVNDTPTTQ